METETKPRYYWPVKSRTESRKEIFWKTFRSKLIKKSFAGLDQQIAYNDYADMLLNKGHRQSKLIISFIP